MTIDNMDVNNDKECRTDQLDKAPTESETTLGSCPLKSTLDAQASLGATKESADDGDRNNNNDAKSGWTGGASGEERNEPLNVGKAEPILNEIRILEELKKPKDPPSIILLRKSFQSGEKFQEASTCKHVKSGYSAKNNNNNNCDSADYYDERNFLLAMGDEGRNNWKNESGEYFGDEEDYRMRFPWKRIAYIGILLVLGITCAILALMKLCGGADWMNKATFSVIIMGTVMLLPPGLYYGRIMICICFRCKEYSLWDVPAGPFG